jgi:hypothetical protein
MYKELIKRLEQLKQLKDRVIKTGSTRDNRFEIEVRGRNNSTYYRFISMETLLCCLNRGDAKMNDDNIPQAVTGPWDQIS